MKTLTKALLWAALPIALLGVTARSLANAIVPVPQIVSQLQAQTRVPVLIPNAIPGMDRVYVNTSASPTRYNLSFDYTPDCQGSTPCNYGGISAEQGGVLTTPSDLGPRDSAASVRLANGTQGLFTNFCGAYCTAIVQWQDRGVLYSVYVKNGRQQDVVALANAAIGAGVRTAGGTSSPTVRQMSTPYGQAVDQQWSLAARLEEQGDFNSAQIRYQRALEVAQTLRNSILRDCAVSGFQARIQAMEAARAYLRTNGTNAHSIQAAHEVATSTFRRTIDALDQTRPDLANRCP